MTSLEVLRILGRLRTFRRCGRINPREINALTDTTLDVLIQRLNEDGVEKALFPDARPDPAPEEPAF